MSGIVKVAVTQHEPVWFDLQATVDKTCRLIEEASSNGAQLVAFPEVWITGYPAWICRLTHTNTQGTSPRSSARHKIHQKLTVLRFPRNGPDMCCRATI
ncbi:hypothetical protein M3J09_000266 [Ascochyta lentis]